MNNNKINFYIINEEGIREEAQILAKFKLTNGKDYITYTFNEVNDNQMIKIYTTGVENEDGVFTYREIIDNDEWTEIKNVMKELAKDATEEVPAEVVSNLKISGEEVSVRKPKKLLVSVKFADTLASKYSEKEEVKVEEPIITPVEPVVADPVIPEEVKEETKEIPADKEDLLSRTIEIPTFEQLQARNKALDSVMEAVKPTIPEVPVAPVVEPVIPVVPEIPEVPVTPVEPVAPVVPDAPVVTPIIETPLINPAPVMPEVNVAPVMPVMPEAPVVTPVAPVEPVAPVMDPIAPVATELQMPEMTQVAKEDYTAKFKKEVEPVLLDVYAKQQQQIEALEEELSKTKFNLFEKQKEALSLKKEVDESSIKQSQLEAELSGVQQKMNGILNVIQGGTPVDPTSNNEETNM